jgi:rubrerythrin
MDHSKAYLHSEEEAVKMAIEKEIAVQKFYRENAERMAGGLTKKTFIYLAEQERKHEETIKKFNEQILRGKNPDVSLKTITIEKMKQFLGENMEAVREKMLATKDELRVYDMAKERELQAFKFYKEAAGEASHESVKRLFTFLMHEEDGHYHLLANVISYLKNPENYFMDNEGWNFEGA